MRLRWVALLVLLCAFSGWTQDGNEATVTAPAPYQDADAYQVYAAVLPTVKAMVTLSNPLIQRETHTLNPSSECTPASEYQDALSPVMENYRNINRKPWLLQPKLKLDRPYQLVPQAELRKFYPRSHHIILSAVGFNASHTIAVVYIADHCPGGLCSSGQVYAAEKKNGKWKPMREGLVECGWIS